MATAQAKGKDKAAKAAETETKAVVAVKAGAMSVDVGPFVVKNWAQANADEEKAQELISGANKKRYDLNAKLTLAIAKAATADKSINLAATTIQGPEGSKAMSVLNDQLYLALGLKVSTTVGKGDKEVQKLVYAPDVASYFPQAGEDKNTKEAKARQTLRSNLSHTIKKCAMTALAIMERKIKASYDNKAGTLLLSGPTIKKDFGVDKVHLDERQTIPGRKEGEEIKLKEKPSFTAIADMAARDHGAGLRRGSNTRGKGASGDKTGSGTTLIDPTAALKNIAVSVVRICETFKKNAPNDEQLKELTKMRDALDTLLD